MLFTKKYAAVWIVSVGLLASSQAQSPTPSIRVNITTRVQSGVGSTSPSTTGVTNTSTVSATAPATIHPSSGTGSVVGTWQLLVTYSGFSVNPPTVSGTFNYGFQEESAAFAVNHQTGASASGSSYTYDTSNSASVGIGLDNPANDDYFSPTPDPSTNISTGATMTGSGSSWTYVQNLVSTEAYATATLTGTYGTDPHATASASSSEYASLSTWNIIVVTH